MPLFDGLLVLHIAGGAIALLSGPVPMLSRKGSPLHRRAGDLYAVAMTVTAVSALFLALITGKMFFAALAVFALFLIFNGARAIGFRRQQRPSTADDAVCIVTAAFSAWLLWHGVESMDVTGVFFGAGGAILAWSQWRRLRDPAVDWLRVHLTSMGAAYTATATAFLAVNLTFLPRAVAFIVPALVGTAAISWAVARYARGAVARSSLNHLRSSHVADAG
jgi:uncharacterized membrane protein